MSEVGYARIPQCRYCRDFFSFVTFTAISSAYTWQ